MKVAVTGASGFIASHLVERLLADGHAVTAVDALTDDYDPAVKIRNMAKWVVHPHVTFLQADLATCPLDFVEKAEVVFHLAGKAGVRSSYGIEFARYLSDNLLATQRLLEAKPQRLVFASSSSVYGQVVGLAREDTALVPLSPYGVTKLACEHLIRVYGTSAVILRFFSVYGPRQRPDMAFAKFIQAMKRNDSFNVYGDGEQTRDFTYVGDVVDAVVAAGTKNVVGETFNIGGGLSVTLNAAIAMLERVMCMPAKSYHVPPPPGDPRNTKADISKAQHLLGFHPRTSLEEGLKAQVWK